MIDLEKLNDIVSSYKEYFLSRWEEEKYKWEAVAQFQKYWDIESTDFASMFESATDKAENLLTSFRFYPRNMMLHFAKTNPEDVRRIFIQLYDESQSLQERVEMFQNWADEQLEQHKEEGWNHHYQNTNTISIYLWLRYPDKYYIYKYSECLEVAKQLHSDWIPKKNRSAENLINCFELYHEICRYLQPNTELQQLLENVLTKDCYPDLFLRTMTIDVGFFISRVYGKTYDEKSEDWFPVDYHPGFTVEDWVHLLQNRKIFHEKSLKIMKRMKDYGGMATCKQLSEKYGESYNFYNSGSSSLARRIAEETNCPVVASHHETVKWWPILYIGKYTEKKQGGHYLWKLREELNKALDFVDLSQVELYAKEKLPILEQEDDKQEQSLAAKYGEEDFLAEVYLDKSQYKKLCSVLRYKKNLILQGAPGVGKTFVAKKLAYAIMGEQDDSRIAMVQFHQNYTYEDFIMGYKPDGEGFQLVNGIFYTFCQKACEHPERCYFFLIDEINRGNISKIFGELLQLLEPTYRGSKLVLSYSGTTFCIPENLYLIGMMNTADRSLAMIDYALRRRFAFFEIKPAFDSPGFLQYMNSFHSDVFLKLIKQIQKLNEEIQQDDSLGSGFCIGHSYFCDVHKLLEGVSLEERLEEIVVYEIIPMIQEYWFDSPKKVQNWENRLRGVFYDK